MNVKEALQKALDAFGPNGENWSKVDSSGIMPEKKQCSLTACGLVTAGYTNESFDLFYKMRAALSKQLNASPHGDSGTRLGVIYFNDHPKTTFADVKALFERAIADQEKEK